MSASAGKTRTGKKNMCKRYGGQGDIRADDIYEACVQTFGAAGARYAADIAESKFDEFAESMTLVGLLHISEGKDDLSFQQRVRDRYERGCKFSSAPLIMRYPFLCTRAVARPDTEDNGNNPPENSPGEEKVELGYPIYYDSIPVGWAARFGLEMCEDIRTILLGGDENTATEEDILDFSEYAVQDVKEKFGTLRWDGYCRNKEKNDDIENLTYLYEKLSAGTCCDCGSISDVYMDSHGWIVPICLSCRSVDKPMRERKVDQIRAFLQDIDPAMRTVYIPWDLVQKAGAHLVQQECTWERVDLEKFSYEQYSPGKEEEEIIFPYLKLREKYDHLQVFKLAEKYCRIDEPKIVSIEELRSEVSEIVGRRKC